MNRMLLSFVLIVLVIGMAVAGCVKPAPSSVPTPTAAPPKTLDIAVLCPLTGPAADLGTNVQNAILLAIDDQNAGILLAGGPNKEGGHHYCRTEVYNKSNRT